MISDSIRAYLEQHEFVRGLSPEYLDLVEEHVTEEKFAPQQCVFAQDTEADHFYIVREGQVDVEIPSLVGAPAVLQSLSSGSVLGWSWLIPPYQWHFEARATKPSTLLVFDGKQLRDRCENDPAFGYEMLKRFAALMMNRLVAARIQVIESFEGH